MREHDPHDETMGVSIGSGSIASPMRDVPVTSTATPLKQYRQIYAPPEQHTPGCAHNVGDAEHDPITHFQEMFPIYSHVTRMGTLTITFLVDDDLVPMKLEKLPGI